MFVSVLPFALLLLSSVVALPVIDSTLPVQISNAALPDTLTVSDSFLVAYKDTATADQVKKHQEDVHKTLGNDCSTPHEVGKFRGLHIKASTANLASVASSSIISFVERDLKVSIAPAANHAPVLNQTANSLLAFQPSATWGLGRLSHKGLGFYNYIYDSSACAGTTVYVVDTGIRISHQEFGGRAKWGKNFVAGASDIDDNGHGTHCAGTIAGSSVGVCKQANVIAVKVLNSAGAGYLSTVLAGMQWALNDAISKGKLTTSVISLSLGGPFSAYENAAIESIVAAGMTVVVAAGNLNIDAQNVSPASAPNVITVGAIDINSQRAGWSNYGKALDIFAPGVDIYSTWGSCDNCYWWMSGTSQATPHVAGLAAYLMSKYGLATPKKVAAKISSLGVRNTVLDPKGSTNKVAYNGNGA